jgi:hypothetical protein
MGAGPDISFTRDVAFNPGWAQSLRCRVKLLDVAILLTGLVYEAAEVSVLVLTWKDSD